MEAKFKVGDKLKVVKYGRLMKMPTSEFEKFKQMGLQKKGDREPIGEVDGSYLFDLMPETVGKEGVVISISVGEDDLPLYKMDIVTERECLFDEAQLESVEAPKAEKAKVVSEPKKPKPAVKKVAKKKPAAKKPTPKKKK